MLAALIVVPSWAACDSIIDPADAPNLELHGPAATVETLGGSDFVVIHRARPPGVPGRMFTLRPRGLHHRTRLIL